MARYDDTEIGGHRVHFATTHWTLLEQVRGPLSPAHQEVLNLLIAQYWKPVYCFIRRQYPRYDKETAKDVTQSFFVHCLTEELFGRADRKKGRFRNLLLQSLKNYLANYERGQHAQKRAPVGQIMSIDALMEEEDMNFEPAVEGSAEAAFDREFTLNQIKKVLDLVRTDFLSKGQQVHWEIFRRQIVNPILQDTQAPGLDALAREFGLSRKQVSNRLITTRRAFQRLFREYVGSTACSEEDVAAEVDTLSRFVAGS